MSVGNLFLQVMRNRMMVDRGIAEQVYLPFFVSLLKGNEATMLKDRGGERLEFGLFNRQGFTYGADRVNEMMESAPWGSVAIVPVVGEFLKYGTMCAWGANEIAPVIRKAAGQRNISAVVLDIDSGGGAENAVPPFIEAIRTVQEAGKPVVVHGDLVASAAYYAASFADYIVADNPISSAFGSIGAFVTFADFREQLKMNGIELKQIYSTRSDLKNEAYRAVLDRDDSEPLLKKSLDPAVDRFVATVKRNRRGKIAEDSEIWRGALIEGEEIVSSGLADRFGRLEEAAEVALALAGI